MGRGMNWARGCGLGGSLGRSAEERERDRRGFWRGLLRLASEGLIIGQKRVILKKRTYLQIKMR